MEVAVCTVDEVADGSKSSSRPDEDELTSARSALSSRASAFSIAALVGDKPASKDESGQDQIITDTMSPLGKDCHSIADHWVKTCHPL